MQIRVTPHVALLPGDALPSVITILYDFIAMAYKGLQNPKSAFSMFRIWGRLIILETWRSLEEPSKTLAVKPLFA